MAGLREGVADRDLIELPEELLLLHPELPVLELGQEPGLVCGLQLAPPFTPFSPESLPALPAPGVQNAQQEDGPTGPTLSSCRSETMKAWNSPSTLAPALGLSTEQLIRHRSFRRSICRQVLSS